MAERSRVVAERSDALGTELQATRQAGEVAAEAIAGLRAKIAGLDYSEAAFREFRDAKLWPSTPGGSQS